MIFLPDSSSSLRKHIDYYWIVKEKQHQFGNLQNLFAFPGITPDLLLILDGHLTYRYQGKVKKVMKSQLYSHIHENVNLDLSAIKSFVIVKFKSKGLSSLLPFVDVSTEALMKNSIVDADIIFGNSINVLTTQLNALDAHAGIKELDAWFLSHYKKEREGFMVDLAGELSENFELKEIMKATTYSYSTLERYFKKDTGLSPKKYQAMRRYKQVVQEICTSRNTDWMHYVQTYGYYDQSHFIKEIKRFTSFTPTQLLQVPSFVSYRPI